VDDWNYKSAKDLGLTAGESMKSVRREVGLITTLTSTLRWALIRTYLRLYHRWKVCGREHLPAQLPLILVCNHTSHLDALALASVLPVNLNRGMFPIAAGDTFFETTPVAAFASMFMNALPIWRRNCTAHSLEDLRARLVDEPCGYIIFPEGTRSRTGKMGRFKPGVGKLVAGADVPVVPCHLEGASRALPPDLKWPRPVGITLRIGSPLYFGETPNNREGWNHVATELQTAVEGLRDGRL